jgi:hypothetical protein
MTETPSHTIRFLNDQRLGLPDWVHATCTCGQWSLQFRGTRETARKEWQGHVQEAHSAG